MNLGTVLMMKDKYGEGSELYNRALNLDPNVFEQSQGPVFESAVPREERGAMNYYKARQCAQAGMIGRAIEYLHEAVSEGFVTRRRLARDNSFASLRGNPDFQRLIAGREKQPGFILAGIDVFPGYAIMFRGIIRPLMAAALCLLAAGDQSIGSTPSKMAFAAAMPGTVVWAWQEPEDLHSAPPQSVGVAFLAETIFLPGSAGPGHGNAVAVLRRHEPLLVAPDAATMAVARIIALPGFHDSAELRVQTAAALAGVAQQQGLRALQVDFDAARSQRPFYAAVLARLRPQMPAGMPLSITALVSWCGAAPGPGDWLSSLPIDEAVPMFFRMGGSSLSGGSKSEYAIREPICRGSLGVSIDESWPPPNPGGRIYLFAPRPWTRRQLAALNGAREGVRAPALRYSYAAAGLRPPNDSGLPAPQQPAAPGKPHVVEKLP